MERRALVSGDAQICCFAHRLEDEEAEEEEDEEDAASSAATSLRVVQGSKRAALRFCGRDFFSRRTAATKEEASVKADAEKALKARGWRSRLGSADGMGRKLTPWQGGLMRGKTAAFEEDGRVMDLRGVGPSSRALHVIGLGLPAKPAVALPLIAFMLMQLTAATICA